jgi:S1-C subfamily serine protease
LKRLGGLLALTVAAAAVPCPGAFPDAARVVASLDDVPAAIVQLVSIGTRTGDARTRHGSAFYLSGQGHLLTCFHVLDRMPREDAPRLLLPDGRERRFEVLAVDRETDLALLLSDPPERFLALAGGTLPDVGAPALFAGVAARAGDDTGARTVSFKRCIVAALGTRRAPATGRDIVNIKLDQIADPGHSGGPVLAEGTLGVIGVVRANLERTTGGVAGVSPTGYGLAVPLLYVRPFLRASVSMEH